MTIGNLQLAFIVGLLGVFIVSSAAHGMVERSAATLDRDTRERIWQRLTLGMWWWRVPDIVGVTLMVAGGLRIVGLLPAIGGVAWGIPAMAIGLALVSVASSIRAWMECLAYSHTAPDKPASRNARSAAIVVTLAELCLAGVVCWYVLTHLPASAGRSRSGNTPASRSNSGAQQEEAPAAGTRKPDGPARDPVWADRTEALKLLPGKNVRYLDALVRRGDIRGRTEGNRKLYHRDDIVKTVEAVLPSMEDLLEDQKTKSETPQPPEKKAPEPPAPKKAAPGEALRE